MLTDYRHHHHHHHHNKHQGLDALIRSISRVTAARANASSVFQLFSFLVVYSGVISKGFGFVAFFASVKASSVCIHLSCLVCLQSVVRGVCSHLFCGHTGCSLPEVSVTSGRLQPLWPWQKSTIHEFVYIRIYVRVFSIKTVKNYLRWCYIKASCAQKTTAFRNFANAPKNALSLEHVRTPVCDIIAATNYMWLLCGLCIVTGIWSVYE